MQSRTMWMLSAAALLASTACDSDDTAADSPPMRPLFSLVVIADPHVTGDPSHEARLLSAVEWVNEQAGQRNVELVLVVGDIGWGDGLERSKQLLDGLSVPYVPVRGDNELHGWEASFEQVYGSQYDRLAQTLEGWRKAPVPVWDPVAQQDVWLQNIAFTHRGVDFLVLDWCPRGLDDIMGEFGVLNDYEGGTFPWLASEMASLQPREDDSVVFVSHMPMFLGVLDHGEMDAIEEVVRPLDEQVYANFAGHLHFDYHQYAEGFDVFVTDATWDDDNTLRVVDVSGNGQGFAYDHEIVALPQN